MLQLYLKKEAYVSATKMCDHCSMQQLLTFFTLKTEFS